MFDFMGVSSLDIFHGIFDERNLMENYFLFSKTLNYALLDKSMLF